MLISVIIPTCHRDDLLAACLARFASHAQTLTVENYEVIVSDDGSRTTARELVVEKFPWVKWTAGPKRGPAANRNHGASLATGEWLAFVDDDCEPDSGWLKAITKKMSDADVVEGKTICPAKRDTPFEEHVENLTGGVLWSCNFAIRRDVFRRLGGFDEDFLEAGGEDMELAWRIRRNGLRVAFAPDAIVFHPPRKLTWPMLWRRATWQQRWSLLYRIKTGARTPFAIGACADLLRTTLHLLTRFDRGTWRAQFFRQVMKWATFPLVLPYLAFWNARFRKRAHITRTPGS